MSFRVSGDYFESCTCDVSCNCIFLGEATQDHCDVVIGWHITDGQRDQLGLLIGKVAGVTSAPITFESQNGKRRLVVGSVIEGEIAELQGGDGKTAPVISNAPFGALPQPVRQGRAEHVRYNGHWQTDLNGTNAFLAEFA